MINVVTFCRQLGSRGREVASGVAEVLEWRLVHRELINQAAIRVGAPEIALAEIDELGFFQLHLRPQVRRAYLSEMESLARSIAGQGRVVFLCRGGHIMLRHIPAALHIRVIAPYEQRLAWLMDREHISRPAAAARLMVSDQVHSRSLRRDYGSEACALEAYHLVINLAGFSVPAAVSLVVQAVQADRVR